MSPCVSQVLSQNSVETKNQGAWDGAVVIFANGCEWELEMLASWLVSWLHFHMN